MTHTGEGAGGQGQGLRLSVNSPYVLTRYRAQQATTGLARERYPGSQQELPLRGVGQDLRLQRLFCLVLGPWQLPEGYTLVAFGFFKMEIYCFGGFIFYFYLLI